MAPGLCGRPLWSGRPPAVPLWEECLLLSYCLSIFLYDYSYWSVIMRYILFARDVPLVVLKMSIRVFKALLFDERFPYMIRLPVPLRYRVKTVARIFNGAEFHAAHVFGNDIHEVGRIQEYRRSVACDLSLYLFIQDLPRFVGANLAQLFKQ